MIDWWRVATNGLWVLGLSVVLAVLSYHDWLRRKTGRTWSQLSDLPSFELSCAAGWCMTSLGWALSQSSRWWEKALFFALTAFFLKKMAAVATSYRFRHHVSNPADADCDA